MKSVTKRKPKTAERRRAPRRQPAIGTVCQFAAGSQMGGLGLVWNISTTGLSVLSSRSCETGIHLTGDLKSLDAEATLPISFEVAHVKELGTGDFVIAGPFARTLAAAKIKPFIRATAKPRTPSKV